MFEDFYSMKFFIAILFSISLTVFGQTRNIIWSHHDSTVATINGISFGVGSFMTKTSKTNGIKLDIPGAGILLPFVGHLEPPHGTFFMNDSLILASSSVYDTTLQTSTNGVYLSVGGDAEHMVNGISVNPLFTLSGATNGIGLNGFIGFLDIMRGISITSFWNSNAKAYGITIAGMTNYNIKTYGIQVSLFNKSVCMKGIQIGGIHNSAYIMKGLQIGLFNKSENTTGIQVGLFNKNEKRSLPFINWNFK